MKAEKRPCAQERAQEAFLPPTAVLEQLEASLRMIKRRTDVSLAFAGQMAESGAVRLSLFEGPTAGALRGVEVESGHGLGGRAVELSRSIAVGDYLTSPRITHRYDRFISAEGLHAMVAAPVIVGRRPVAVVYGAFREAREIGGRIQDAMAGEVRALEQRLAVLSAMEAGFTDPAETAATLRMRERIRDTYGDLRTLAGRVSDAAVQAEILRIGGRLLDGEADAPGLSTLSRRERDAVALASRGLTNQQIGEALGLSPGTIKSYMKSAMRKLGAATRLEAAILARRTGQIP
ncbi:regulatory LuxR family protein [Actinocorallia herbida]|uniref:Regulatory LuxR family protein n=1 Tax=Actinocorallia herbida TaxID=58109 RepID=A0A3N1D205_9ACTN|nr:LuxR C-terminal-related transcriptional regulator [Actinocorallia herbida]ROO87542.1 regulatory LuxR family protein [Actinocorallia herbida]